VRCGERAQRFPYLLSHHLPGRSYQEALWTCPFGFWWRLLHWHDCLLTGWGNSVRPMFSDSSWPLCAAFLPSGCGLGLLWTEEGVMASGNNGRSDNFSMANSKAEIWGQTSII
jgi:hypothetical protein